MKIARWLCIVLVIAIFVFAIYELVSDVAMARDYYRTNEVPWLVIFGGSAAAAIAGLMYRDKISQEAKRLHALLGTGALALVFTYMAVKLTVTIVHIENLVPGTAIKNPALVAALSAYAVAAVLWWYTLTLIRKHRTNTATTSSAPRAADQ